MSNRPKQEYPYAVTLADDATNVAFRFMAEGAANQEAERLNKQFGAGRYVVRFDNGKEGATLPTNLELRPVFADVAGLYNGRPIHVCTVESHQNRKTPGSPLGLHDARRVAAKLALAYNSHDALVKALTDLSAVVMDYRTTGKPDLGRMAEATDNAVNLLAKTANAGAINALRV